MILGPHLFITATANPKWNELANFALQFGVPVSDCPTALMRIWNAKWLQFVKDIVQGQVFGICIANIWAGEYQGRTLPHAHLTITLDQNDAPMKVNEYDKFVCAELPFREENDELFKLVTSVMLHVCGERRPGQKCCNNKENKCSKGFHKEFAPVTTKDDGDYPIYRRRSPQDGGNEFVMNEGMENQYTVDNRDVVPYNPRALMRLQSHCNVEIVKDFHMMKYTFKYLLKGPDRVLFGLREEDASVSVNVQSDSKKDTDADRNINECTQMRDARWWGAPEAASTRLNVHLENCQSVVLPGDRPDLSSIQKQLLYAQMLLDKSKKSENTTLLMWFAKNIEEKLAPVDKYPDGTAAPDLLYTEFPRYYIWNKSKKVWTRGASVHLKFPRIGRMHQVTMFTSNVELFYLRLLLFYVNGATCYADIRTVGDTVHDSFREACLARNLLSEDKEWSECLEENECFITANQLRKLFCNICLECNRSDPLELFRSFDMSLSDDFFYRGFSPKFSTVGQRHNASDRELSLSTQNSTKSRTSRRNTRIW